MLFRLQAHKNSGGEVIYISKSSVEMVDGSTWTANAGVHVNDTSSLSVVDSSIVTGSVVVASTASLSLTVTDEKLASLGGSAYYMINQTGTGAALDLGINYNGNVYNVGDSITIGDVVYSVTNGDGNDISNDTGFVDDDVGGGGDYCNRISDLGGGAPSEGGGNDISNTCSK